MESRWYILHTMSGHENKVAKLISEQAQKKGIGENFEEIIVPTENVVEIKRGQKVAAEKKFLPGYILVKMKMDDNSWHLVKNIPKVSGFLGGSGKPQPISEAEANRIFKQMEESTSSTHSSVAYEVGESVKVIDGPFDSFVGVVQDVDNDKNRLKVSVSIFGRSTPVELEFTQVEKQID